jgi:hypothetical protein
MKSLCPFHADTYIKGLSTIGSPKPHISGHFYLLKRSIEGTPYVDGVGPWPYLHIENKSMLDALKDDFQDLVTLTVVTQPGFIPRGSGLDPVFLKDHYVFDPKRPIPRLSSRARKRLAKVEQRAIFEQVFEHEDQLAFTPLYRDLIQRRGLKETYIDFSLEHFASIAALSDGIFFRVRDDATIGAMACGVVFGDVLQILHMVFTPEGLGWNASYLLMKGLQDYALAHQLRLMTGGMPAGASEGLRIFKARWANHMEPVYLLRRINALPTYQALCAQRGMHPSYFPAYRGPSY